MSHRRFVLTASLLLVLAGAPVASAQDGGAAPPAAPPASGEKVKLAPAFHKGDKLGFEMSMSVQQTMNMGGMEVPTEIGLNQTWVETCDAIDDKGVACLRTKFVRVHGTFSNPMMGEFPFDSDKPQAEAEPDEGNPMAAMGANITKMFTMLASLEMETKIGADGTVLSAKRVAGEAGAGMDPEDMAKQMGGLGKLPADAVGVGDSWVNESTMNAGMGMKLKTKIKNVVHAIDSDAVTLRQEGEITKLPAEAATSDDPQQQMMAQMMEKMTLSASSMKGTTKVSRKDGRILSSEMDSTIKMEIPADDAGGGMPGGMKMEQTMKIRHARLDKIPEPAKKAEPAPAPAPAKPGDSAPVGPGK